MKSKEIETVQNFTLEENYRLRSNTSDGIGPIGTIKKQCKELDEVGVICVRRLFSDWVPLLKQGVQSNLMNPSSYASTSYGEDHKGFFFDDYCNWQRIPEFSEFIYHSPAAQLAGEVMNSISSRILLEHVIVKNANTSAQTPWHHDAPYLNILGDQLVNIWIALHPADRGICPEFIAASHKIDCLFTPKKFADSSLYEKNESDLVELPDLSNEKLYPRIGWDVQAGDALIFHAKTLHGTSCRETTRDRWAFSTIWMASNIRYGGYSGGIKLPWDYLSKGATIPESHCPTIWLR